MRPSRDGPLRRVGGPALAAVEAAGFVGPSQALAAVHCDPVTAVVSAGATVDIPVSCAVTTREAGTYMQLWAEPLNVALAWDEHTLRYTAPWPPGVRTFSYGLRELLRTPQV